jgi:hypothetical protein
MNVIAAPATFRTHENTIMIAAMVSALWSMKEITAVSI